LKEEFILLGHFRVLLDYLVSIELKFSTGISIKAKSVVLECYTLILDELKITGG
jgi:hypothetical protein